MHEKLLIMIIPVVANCPLLCGVMYIGHCGMQIKRSENKRGKY
jgi:hypothetical protein